MILLENCANSVQSCVEAERGGAHRIEFCAGLPEGGTTPSFGALKVALQEVRIPIFPIIRPRSGDFIYTDLEVRQMLSDIYAFRELGVAGFVFGALTPDGTLDCEVNQKLLRAAEGVPVTLHRAFDMTRDMENALEQAIDLGFSRILTSGGQNTALEGSDAIRKLVHKAGNRIIIMAGSGITPDNALDLVSLTGVTEVHGTLQSTIKSPSVFYNPNASMQSRSDVHSYDYPETDSIKVRTLLNHFQ